MSRAQALVLWSRENKVGIEKISHVPDNARFVGAATPVMFEGDKKFYPAKILMISNNHEELEVKMAEVEAEIEEAKKTAGNGPPSKRSRKAKSKPKPGVASDRAIATAVGGRPTVPQGLVSAHQESQQARKEAKASLLQNSSKTDQSVLAEVKKKLEFSSPKKSQPPKPLVLSETVQSESDDDWDSDDGDEDDAMQGEEQRETADSKDVGSKWCECGPCALLKKYENPTFYSFLKEVGSLLEANVDSSIKEETKYLKLLPIGDDIRKVELAAGHGVYIAQATRDELKVDNRNKPGQLARETLYALYGKDVFRTVIVTGRGNKVGAYTIPDPVKKAVASFVNRYTPKDKVFTTKSLVSLINKRAPEWRKQTTPKSQSKKMVSKKRSKPGERSGAKSSTATLRTPSKSPALKTPMKSKASGMLTFHVTPMKSPTPSSAPSSLLPMRQPDPPPFDVMASLNGKPSPNRQGNGGNWSQPTAGLSSSAPPAPTNGQQWHVDHQRYPRMASEFPQPFHQTSPWKQSSNPDPRCGPYQGYSQYNPYQQMSSSRYGYAEQDFISGGMSSGMTSPNQGPLCGGHLFNLKEIATICEIIIP